MWNGNKANLQELNLFIQLISRSNDLFVYGLPPRLALIVIVSLLSITTSYAQEYKNTPNQEPLHSSLRCSQEKKSELKQQSLWISRCYQGNVTLENYATPASQAARAKSNLLWGIIEDFAGFQEPEYSAQWINARQSMSLIFFLMAGGHLGWTHDVAKFSHDIRQTGPVIQGKGFDTHQRVRLFYSDAVVQWLQNDRQGDIPNGSVIVKQMYSSDPADNIYGADRVTGWAVMIKNSHLSKDGWIWYLFFFPEAPPYNAPVPVAYGQTEDNFCLSCHAAADNKELTFASLSNLQGTPQQYTWVDHTFPGLFSQHINQKLEKQLNENTGSDHYSNHLGIGNIKMPRFDEATQQSFGGGIAHFQQLGISGEPIFKQVNRQQVKKFTQDFQQAIESLKTMSPKEKNVFVNELVQTLIPNSTPQKESLPVKEVIYGKNNGSISSGRLAVLFDKLIIELKQTQQNGDYEIFLEQVMETYFRLLTQKQPVVPLATANSDILMAYDKQSQVKLKPREADLDWLPLDFIFSHTPSLPKKLPENICKVHQLAGIEGFTDGEDKESDSIEVTDCRDTFMTSDNCNGCHWSYVLQGESFPNMLTPVKNDTKTESDQQKLWDISPYAEWSASMMGLAGRDPIFNAQLEWERENKPELADQISNLCLRCHQAGAQRQFHLDQDDPEDTALIVPPDELTPRPLYTADYLYLKPKSQIDNPSKWGALGRDGINCTVCHQIEKKDLGEASTFTGQFHFPEKPGQVFGPYTDNSIKPYLMEQAIGIKPVYGEHIQESALCGSCHTVITPIVSDTLNKDAYRTGYEQTTYPEWLNSEFSGAKGKSCQKCHMPSRLPEESSGQPMSLSEIIANVETAFLPPLKNRAVDDLITPTEKSDYRRHTLVGMNQFANQMFQQFPDSLGHSSVNPGGMRMTQPPLLLAQKEMEYLAQNATLNLEIINQTNILENSHQFDVIVENLVGHKFPSGVGFRRAFIEFKVIDKNGFTIWSSGTTNAVGQITNINGEVLPSEMTTDPLEIQTGNALITQTDQVYIFEERTVTWKDGEQRDPGEETPPLDEMTLSTSFLEIVGEAKDTRLLPKGWDKNGPYAEFTELSIIDDKTKQVIPYYPEKPGYRTIRYQFPKNIGEIERVEVTVHYQSIPPYYIQERLQFNTEAAQRLYYMIAHLRTRGTPIENWTIKIKEASLQL